jgi:cob(I)alamin adenosyltransferase
VSIVTRTGDKGTTALMYGRRVMKCHPRVEAYGAVDELNAALGVVRAAARDDDFVVNRVLGIQKDLVVLMGELGVLTEDLQRYVQDGHSLVTPEMISRLEEWIRETEAAVGEARGWATPGANPKAATMDVARTVCRRAERRVCALQQDGQLRSGDLVVYLNRLSDFLWLLARRAERDTASTK